MTDLNALLFVELNEASPWQTQEFSRGMSGHNWQPVDVDGWFCSRFERCTADEDILKATETALQLVTDELRISDWDSVCLISEPPAGTRQGFYLNGTQDNASRLEPDQLSDLTDFFDAPASVVRQPDEEEESSRSTKDA